jgi:hypothetical protein
MENDSMPRTTPDGRIEDLRVQYVSRLFVSRPSDGTGEDAALSAISSWLRRRLHGAESKSIFRLEAPPGYGKSWLLAHFVASYPADPHRRVLFFGPFTPLTTAARPDEAYDGLWRTKRVEQFLSSAPFNEIVGKLRTSTDAPFQNLIIALCEDLEQHLAKYHVLFIIDEIDQARNALELEEKLLDPLARYSLSHRVSLLLAIRSDFGFRTVEQLRRPDQFERFVMGPFRYEQQYRQQMINLAMVAAMPVTEAEQFAAQLIASLPDYKWGIPALNAELGSLALRKETAARFEWSAEDIEACLLNTLRLASSSVNDSADNGAEQWGRQLLHTARRLCSKKPAGWRIEDVRTLFGCDEQEAADFRNNMYQLNLIQRPPDKTFGTYWFLPDWQGILQSWQILAEPSVSPVRQP